MRKRERKGMALEGWGVGKDLGEVERRGTIIRIYCLKNIFNKKLGLSTNVL